MKVEWVRLTSFLSYASADVQFGEGLNIIVGENAVGKTNLVDSIYYASLGKTSRQNKDKELLRWGAKEGARVSVRVQSKFGAHTIDIYVDEEGKKRVAVDGLPLQRMGELMGVLRIVFFAPNEMRLVKESPQDRRRFMDIHLCQQSKTYFYTLQRYQKLLLQRNKALKTYQGKTLAEMLDAVDAEFSRAAAFLAEERRRFAAELTPFAAAAHAALTEGKEAMALSYESQCTGNAEEVLAQLREARENDVRFQYTTVGPHRDDMKITVNGIDLRKYGSQGQQRSAVLSLKLAEVEAVKARTGEPPVLLLDDVLSELDAGRRAALLNAVKGVQTVLTCTEFPSGEGGAYRKIAVANGVVTCSEEHDGR